MTFPFSRGNLPFDRREDCFPQGCFAIAPKSMGLAMTTHENTKNFGKSFNLAQTLLEK
jgi:hypothetical protein